MEADKVTTALYSGWIGLILAIISLMCFGWVLLHMYFKKKDADYKGIFAGGQDYSA